MIEYMASMASDGGNGVLPTLHVDGAIDDGRRRKRRRRPSLAIRAANAESALQQLETPLSRPRRVRARAAQPQGHDRRGDQAMVREARRPTELHSTPT